MFNFCAIIRCIPPPPPSPIECDGGCTASEVHRTAVVEVDDMQPTIN